MKFSEEVTQIKLKKIFVTRLSKVFEDINHTGLQHDFRLMYRFLLANKKLPRRLIRCLILLQAFKFKVVYKSEMKR